MEGPMRVWVVATGVSADEVELDAFEPVCDVGVLRLPDRPAWRTASGRPAVTPHGGTRAVGSAAVSSDFAADTEVDKMEAPVADVAEVMVSVDAEAVAPAEASISQEAGSTAQDLIQRASEFATRNDKSAAPTMPPEATPGTEVRSAAQAEEEAAPVVSRERMLPGFEAPEQHEPRVRRKRGGLLSRVSGGRQRLFSQPEEASAQRVEPAAPIISQPKPSEGMVDAPRVTLDPGSQLNDPSIPEDKLDIPAFLRRPSNWVDS